MLRFPEFLREMQRGEEEAVHELLRAAFATGAEAERVRQLRRSGAIAGESVLPFEGAVVGYFALSQMMEPKGWLALGPVAIHPDWQGQRHGTRMVGMLAEWARRSGAQVVVCGKPGFFERAGFSVERAAGLTSPYPLEETALLAPGEGEVAEVLRYPKAFGA